MEAAPAKESGWPGVPLSDEELNALVKNHIKAYWLGGEVIVAINNPDVEPRIRSAIICTRPPCWP